jgi:hypothetical protein
MQPSVQTETVPGNLWFLPVVFGVPGLYDICSAVSGQNFAEFLSGVGRVLFAAFFLLQGVRFSIWRPLQWSVPDARKSTLAAALAYAGLILVVGGFAVKHRFL